MNLSERMIRIQEAHEKLDKFLDLHSVFLGKYDMFSDLHEVYELLAEGVL
jgi:hypothetical protein